MVFSSSEAGSEPSRSLALAPRRRISSRYNAVRAARFSTAGSFRPIRGVSPPRHRGQAAAHGCACAYVDHRDVRADGVATGEDATVAVDDGEDPPGGGPRDQLTA